MDEKHQRILDDAGAAWRAAYKARLIECGLPEEDAEACSEAVDVIDMIANDEDPKDSADDELYYMAQDGE